MQIIRVLSMWNTGLKRLQERPLCLLCAVMNVLQLFNLRPMTEDDLDAVMAIETASYTTPWKAEHFRDELAARFSWPLVADEEGNVVGYVCLMSLFEEAQILNIAVSPGQRGRGIARMMMEGAIRLAREKGAEKVALEVRASNAAAISLYGQLGFERVGVRSGYYEASEDAILMEKSIKENP